MHEYYPFQPHIVPEKTQIRSLMSKVGASMLAVFAIMQMIATVLLIIVVAFSSDSEAINRGDVSSVMNGIASIIALIISSFILSRSSGVPMTESVSFKRIPAKKGVCLVFVGIMFCTLANYVAELLVGLFSLFDVDITSGYDLQAGGTDDIFATLMLLLGTAVVPALLEELMFRGVVLGVLRKFGDGFAIIVSAVLFGLLHGNFLQIPFAFTVGLVLAFVTVYSGSILPAIIIHFYNNSVAVVQEILIDKMDEEVFGILFVGLTILTTILGLIAASSLVKNDSDFMKLKDDKTFEQGFSVRVRTALTEPATVIFSIIMIAQAVFYVVAL